MTQSIFIIDFGSQTCHLIGRRLQGLGIKTTIIDSEKALEKIKKSRPAGIIFSGGPASVYEKRAPTIDKKIFDLGTPILGICYGWQLIAYLMGGKVVSGHKEYGPANLKIDISQPLFTQIDSYSRVWVSHGDTVVKLPQGFIKLAETDDIKFAAAADFKKKIFGVQFHPEVEHTIYGKEILKNFVEKICGLKTGKITISIGAIIKNIKNQVGKDKVIAAVSGGIDSTVASILIAKAIGKNLHPVYIESGLMRLGTAEEVKNIFTKYIGIKPVVVKAEKLFLRELKGIIDPEAKRKIIGQLYVELFEGQAKKIKGIKFLAQGTIYSDVIESRGTKRADKIKSHHNVGGLPEKLGLRLLEPLRFFYKDQVRQIAQKLGLPRQIVLKQPFPGPGNAIRIIGEVNKERLLKQNLADKIVMEELTCSGWLYKVFQSFPVMTGTKSTAVKGDERFYGEVVGLRIYSSSDIMTTDWVKLPYKVLQKISSRIVNEVPGVSRVVYDITTKPPATMEWE